MTRQKCCAPSVTSRDDDLKRQKKVRMKSLDLLLLCGNFWGKTTRITVKLLAKCTTEINQKQEVVISSDQDVTHLCCQTVSHTGRYDLHLVFQLKHL